jgi:O-antigen/teichoic acid export membrane protein
MKIRTQQVAFARMLGSAVASQALLSAASFIVGLLLIRHTTDVQYGYFILASTAVLLISALQGAFINPALVNRLTPLDDTGRRDLVGGLHRDQHRVLFVGGVAAIGIAIALWLSGVLDRSTGPLVIATVAATLIILNRGFFRMVMLAYRRPHDVLLGDASYVVLLLGAVSVAIYTPWPAIGAMLGMGVAAGLSGLLVTRALWRLQPWNTEGSPGILRLVAPLAVWSAAGAATHWAFSQGYMYLAAGTLDVTAVAAIAATRLLMMPVNLLSTGIGTLMLPMTAGWLRERGPAATFRRLMLFAAALVAVALCYFAVLWVLRDWLFAEVLRKQFANRDALLLWWALAFLPMIVRDQLLYLLVARERFQQLLSLAVVSAAVSLVCGYLGMLRLGVTGAPIGVLVGELISLAGIVVLSQRHLASRQVAGTDGSAMASETS